MKRMLIHRLGLLGIVSFISYTAAVIFSPLAYPGYDWMAQAVSDLMAQNSPSLLLWNQLSSLYGICGMVSIMSVCIFIQGKLSRTIRAGIYLFAAMNWVSSIGYQVFPLVEGGMDGKTFQDTMHVVVTVLVVLLSVLSLSVILVGGIRSRTYRRLALFSGIALFFMLVGAIGINTVPPQYFGIPERFSVFAAAGFNAVLGAYLYSGFQTKKVESP